MGSQQQIWDEEHRHPNVLLQMDFEKASSGVIFFHEWLRERSLLGNNLSGVEMGCGKGRNSIYLAEKGIRMTAFDFSPAAVETARKRAEKKGVTSHVTFLCCDATSTWPFLDASFDLGIDCFASTDIDTFAGRVLAREEFRRVLKPDGILMVYTLSSDESFHREMIGSFPAEEPNAFRHPQTGKFEKVFEREELLEFYEGFELLEEKRVSKEAEFFGKTYPCLHFWMIFQRK